MKYIQGIQLISGSNEELLPDFQTDFPYIATCAELYKYLSPEIPWHWHSTAELFYMEKGQLEYTTPHGKWRFEAGMGGFLNPNGASYIQRNQIQRRRNSASASV